MRQTRTIPFQAKTFAIRVDSYQNGQMQGAIDSLFLPEPVEFESFPQLVMLIDELLDQEQLQGSPIRRSTSFIPTFELEINFRQHHSWQGRIRKLDVEHETSFRSVLELIIVIDLLLGA